MKKVLLSAALLLASSAATVMASMSPEAAKSVSTAAPAMAAGAPHGHHHHKYSHMTKEEAIAHLKEKGDKTSKDGASLTGVEKDLFDAAMARFNAIVDAIGKFADKDTNLSLSATRAEHELRTAKVVAHHKGEYPAEKIAKWKSKFDELKASAAKLTGDTKIVADTLVSNTDNLFAAVEKTKDTTLLSSHVNALKYEIEALKGVLHHAEHHDDRKAAAMPAAAPAAMMPAATGEVKPADAKAAQ